MRGIGHALALALIASASPALAQDVLPPGHPPVEAGQAHGDEAPAMPPGHPPVEAPTGEPQAMPPGHPPTQALPADGQGAAMPPGHPPMQAPADGQGGAMPPGHPPTQAPADGQGGAMPPGHPPVGGSEGQAMPPGQGMAGGDPHTDVRAVLSPAQIATAEPSEEVPAGTIRVTVVDRDERPIAGAAVDVGVLAQGDRQRHNGETDANGVATFADLPTGSSQAYRVNVPHAGATYSSTPFQLPTDHGYDVRIMRLPVTRDDRFVFFHVLRVIAELRDDRLHIIHQAELTNAGRETFVFPAAGVRAALPEGALAFQAQRVMTDQRIEEVGDSEGYVMRGSVPPGTVQLAWAYDLPVDDDTVSIPVDLPLRFFGLQVLSEAPEGLVLDVRGMPDPQRVENQGQRIWFTQLTRGPNDPRLESITMTLSGIPGPGPLRWLAVVVALLFVSGGVALLFARADDREAAARARRRRSEELLAAIRELELEYEAGEIGPEFRQSRRAELVRSLAVLLHEEEAAKQKEASRPAAKPAGRPARPAG